MKFNQNVDALDTPAIPLALGWGDKYDGTYGPLIDMSQAVPNFPPAPTHLEALSKAASAIDLCNYGAIQGELNLCRAYAAHVSARYDADIGEKQVHITSGCNQAFFACLIALVAPGSTLLTTNPFYFNQGATADVLGYNHKRVDCDPENGFLPSIDALAAAIDDTVSVLALVSPNNPTGIIYPPDLLLDIFELCKARKIWLILDETYREFAPLTGEPLHSLLSQSDWDETLIQLYSFSKTFCIPGHRLGALLGHPKVVTAVAKVMDNMQIHAPRAAQWALADQLNKLDPWIDKNREKIGERAKAFTKVFEDQAGWNIKSLGGYFAYVEHPYSNIGSRDLVKLMASKFGVLPLPGEFFGTQQERFLRFAFANAFVKDIELLSSRLKFVDEEVRRFCLLECIE